MTAHLPPELYETILSHLDEQHDSHVLRILLRTCHAWRFEALRILYRSVELRGLHATDRTDLDYQYWSLLFANEDRARRGSEAIEDTNNPRIRPTVNSDSTAAGMIHTLTIEFPPAKDDPGFPSFVTSLLLLARNLRKLKFSTKELGDTSFLVPEPPSLRFPFRLQQFDTDMAGDHHAVAFLLNQDGISLTHLGWSPHTSASFHPQLFMQKGVVGVPLEGLGHLFPSLHTISCDSRAGILYSVFETSVKRIKTNSLEPLRMLSNKPHRQRVENLQLADMASVTDVQDTFPNLHSLVLGVPAIADIYTVNPFPILRRAHVFLDDLSRVEDGAIEGLSRHMFGLHPKLDLVILFSPYDGWELKRVVAIGTDGGGGGAGTNGKGYKIRCLTDKAEEVYNWISFFEV